MDESDDRPLGDEESRARQVARLFHEHNAALLRFLRLRVKSDQEARDIAQETYLRMLQIDAQDAIVFMRAYLFKIANNLANDRLRKVQVRACCHSDPMFDMGMDELGPDRHVAARQELTIIQQALDELPPGVRTAFLLRRIDGLSTVEIGRHLGMTERSAHNYVVKAMVHCRKRLDEAEF
ncbi:MAG: hypothetical protein ABS87_01615 [Sphingomonas sp. SCN 67-18]|uniref:RNA polymerase sigma factor n=1 Tax=uncultured Sphingomonas sp. TaxID=158754 RepID=UPI00086BB729|nr:sigma-70 family RNA polymerase sigma factor [Sphingomonas sp. SCN 67-18]ODU22605.1 MAG: hypothetical protein ABS87_01615 [Sphingomonas sp. SCN 67-18]